MEEETQVENPVAPTATPEAPASVPSPTEDPVQEELDKIETAKRTKLERLQYTEARVKQQIADVLKANGQQPDDEDRPLTVREFKALQATDAQHTALALADEIEDEHEQKLVKYHIENTIKPSGDAQADFRNARLIVNSVKNGQIAEEAARTTKARTAPTAPAAPPRQPSATPELSKEESNFARAMGLSPEEVAAARQ
jgi:hypothetical protein